MSEQLLTSTSELLTVGSGYSLLVKFEIINK